jgi:hypothetical protein
LPYGVVVVGDEQTVAGEIPSARAALLMALPAR